MERMDMRDGRGNKTQFVDSYLSSDYIERYLRAMTDYTEYHDSDFPFTVELQAAIHKHQHPKSCEESSFLIYYTFVA
jgi:hypothetical protein